MRHPATLLLVVPFLAACGGGAENAAPEPAVGAPAVEAPAAVEPDGPFKGLGLRFDGYYREDRGGLIYLLRFFPEGRAVLANGTGDYEAQLVPKLTPDAKGDAAVGHYNVGVRVDCDSLFFTTRAERGELDYSGTVVGPDTVRFLRYSHINGNRQVKTYAFVRDGSPLPGEAPASAPVSQ